VAMIRWGTTGHQQSIEGTLLTIPDIVAEKNFGAPAVTVIGSVVKLREHLNWFEKRPLFGTRVVVARAREQASELSRELSERGADVLEIPTIKLTPPTEPRHLADVLLDLNSYDWLVFTSPNGVTSFFDYFFRAFEDMRDLGGARIAAVGPSTAARLKELHLKVDLMPEEFIGSKIAKAFAAYQSIENLKIAILRAEVANPELPQALEKLGAIVDDIPCYKTVPETEDATGAGAKLLESGADWITFTSGSTVENFHARFNLPELVRKFPRTKLASIGPETSKAITALGLTPHLQARQHTLEGLVKALESATRNAGEE
jgi:uroporphyrinogen III methyltransferase / synthase